MANTYVLLAKVTVGASGASSIDFTNIPQTGYTDLKLVWSVRANTSNGAGGIYIAFNGSTTSFTGKYLEGTGASAVSGSLARYLGTEDTNAYTSNTFANGEVYIPNYAGSNYKSFSADDVSENNATTAYATLNAGLWSNTAAINQVTLTMGYNFLQYSTAYLYGISNINQSPTSAPKATGGDIIVNDGTYWYHAFRSSGTFTPTMSLTCDALVVAGGGSGGAGNSTGGGGAGGLLGFTSQSLTTTGYVVTVGAGGSGSTSNASNGSNSQFASLTSCVGGGKGGGGTGYGVDGASGGSGGGGYAFGVGGAGTAGQGNSGGNGAGAINPYPGGGGGGASSAGVNGSGSKGGNGGSGSSTYSSWGSATSTGQNVTGTYYYAGGGGEGANYQYPHTPGYGGNGGGANGSSGSGTQAGDSATANTGGGGGGGGYSSGGTFAAGGNGGSGIVIIRYAM